MDDDLESFLSALKLTNLRDLFKINKVSLKDLANFNDDNLKNVNDFILKNLIKKKVF
jgi:hypothetical protein